MGIINLTPDSFSDGGKFLDPQKAAQQAKALEDRGVEILDLGAEASGPNSVNVSEEEELKRLIPALKAIKKVSSLPISVDTYKAAVAEKALQEGASMINDITALRADPDLAQVITKSGCKLIMMYSKDPTARTTIHEKEYEDVIATIKEFFTQRITYAKSQGIKSEQIILDPGMGHYISAIPKYSYEIIARLSELKALGHPILLGMSRKSFLGGSLEEREIKTQALEEIAKINGVNYLRIH